VLYLRRAGVTRCRQSHVCSVECWCLHLVVRVVWVFNSNQGSLHTSIVCIVHVLCLFCV
jgi:hypothetical protein